MSGETLRNLILDRKGSRSYERLARDCGGVPKANRLHAMVANGLNNFPDPATIRGLSRGLNVSITTIVLACARSVGLPVSESGDSDELVLQGAGALPADSKELLVNMSRQLQHAYSRPWGEAPAQNDDELAARVGEHGVNPEDNLP
ncbi:hypothetical protein ACX80U_05835 [Arthrobacter sp. TmT3-37]